MTPVLTRITHEAGVRLARSHRPGPNRLSERAVRRRLTRLDRGFSRLLGELGSEADPRLPATIPPHTRQWLLENDYVISDALEALDGTLGRTFLRRLPGLSDPGGELDGRPRIEALVHELVRMDRGRLDPDEIVRFVQGYQEVHPLRIAELWALPSFLRLVQLEELMAGVTEQPTDVEGGPYILSLRALAALDWRDLMEAMSRVEEVLRSDPAETYAGMDFSTRDRCRRQVEFFSRRTGRDEPEVAEAALALARSAQQAAGGRPPGDPPTRPLPEGHVGYYLLDDGRPDLLAALGAGAAARLRASPRFRRRWAGTLYTVGIVALTGTILWLLALAAGGSAFTPLLLLLAAIPAVGGASVALQQVTHRLVTPVRLPKLEFREGIPDRFRTVVSVPAIAGSVREVRELLHGIETNARANPDPNLVWALLLDLPDAKEPVTARDAAILRAAARGIRELNLQYGPGPEGNFVLLHRPRRWNPSEGLWMGWERKRGKLTELNHLILNRPSELHFVEGAAEAVRGVPFVLTLDADTRLPQDAAARLVGTLAHPLNRPRMRPGGRVARGYTVLQPRISPLPSPDGGTIFSRVFGGVHGLDLYTSAAFDLYQDLFGVGVFAGKGIYDVAAFEASLAGRVPDRSILSHDLFEGAHGRAGLVSDVILLEEYPEHPAAHASRTHRWIRGDWQLVPWLFPSVPDARGGRVPNRFSALSRWMILDNLRRSLQPVFLLLSLVGGWFLLADHAGLWTLAHIALLGLTVLAGTVDAAIRAARAAPQRSDLSVEFRAMIRAFARWGLELSLLPFDARVAADAIVRTVHRVFVSREHLLEWTPAAARARQLEEERAISVVIRLFWAGPVVALLLLVALVLVVGIPSPLVLGLLALWILSPAAVLLAKQPRFPHPGGEAPPVDRARLRALARRSWGFYERFQHPDLHWLPPDHYQEDPGNEVAERTSPTNLGMALVAATTSWDLGFVGVTRFVEHVGRTIDGMRRLPRYRGHFYNWYDIRTLLPLHPQYVSTVDSGNLAASLLVVREALADARTRPIWASDPLEGVADTVRVISELLADAAEVPGAKAMRERVNGFEARLRSLREDGFHETPPEWVRVLEGVRDRDLPHLEHAWLGGGERSGNGASGPREVAPEAVRHWLGHLRNEVEDRLEELLVFFPWLRAEWRDRPELEPLHAAWRPERRRLPSLARLERILAANANGNGAEVGVSAPLPHGLAEAIEASRRHVRGFLDESLRISRQLDEWFDEMSFTFLYDRHRDLFRIGFSVSEGELDPNHYDLLASEARIASIVAMARTDVPARHWTHLARPFRWAGRGTVLLSWAGTMFEYLMPPLFLRMPPDSVLNESCRGAIRVQQAFGRRHRIPWGISESGYHVLSAEGHYQYRAFGVPELGLRRSADTRLVVAPYASLMAMAHDPQAVDQNVERIRALGGIGPWGPYEALDFGAKGKWRSRPRIVRSYMSHHHGMLMAGIGNHLTEGSLVERFHRDPRIRAVESVLFERIPWRRALERKWVDREVPVHTRAPGPGIRSWTPSVRRVPPPVQLLRSGEFVIALGADGRGGSRWRDWSILRGWVGAGYEAGAPPILVLDRDSREAWDPLPGPCCREGDQPLLLFEAHRAEFTRKSRGLRTRMEIFAGPDGGSEIREFILTNESSESRRLRLAFAAEIALAPTEGDLRHPAFHKLFVQAEALPDGEGLLFSRRRGPEEGASPVLLVTLLGESGPISELRWGTSREDFLGRPGHPSRPAALDRPGRLSRREGPHHPLDPLASAIVEVKLPPWGSVTYTALLVVGEDRADVVRRAAEVRSASRREWARVQSRARAEGELLHLGARAEDPERWETFLAEILHPSRIDPRTPGELDLRQSCLWRWGISGDVPYVLLEEPDEIPAETLAGLMRAQQWWAGRGVAVDLVLLDRATGEYQDQLRGRVRDQLGRLGAEERIGRRGGVHLVRAEGAFGEDVLQLRALAALRMTADREGELRAVGEVGVGGPGAGLLPAPPDAASAPGALAARSGPSADAGRDGAQNAAQDGAGNAIRDTSTAVPGGITVGAPRAQSDLPPLALADRFGPSGYARDSSACVIDLAAEAFTPAPWVNVIARDRIGFVVAESGAGFTWARDAGEFRLTPWHNDGTRGPRGEMLYLVDRTDGRVWTPGPGGLGLRRPHRIRHGWGFTSLEAQTDGLHEEVVWTLHPEYDVKCIQLRLVNRGPTPRRLSAIYFAEWVLGPAPRSSAGRLRTEVLPRMGVILASNPFSLRFPGTHAFLASDGPVDGLGTDRLRFLSGAGAADRSPAGIPHLLSPELAATEPGDGACGVLRRDLDLEPGESASVEFFLGVFEEGEAFRSRIAALQRGSADAGASGSPTVALRGERAFAEEREWARYLGRIRIRTPDSRLDRLVNGWLPYQALNARIRGRTGFYQSGGAFGFRDQLQDVYTLLPLDPRLAEAHLVEAARRQFVEGDVLHWWHPESHHGVRTRCSDDLLWLPWVLARTTEWTGDLAIAGVRAPFLEGAPLAPEEAERYHAYCASTEEGTLWEHALRAVVHSAGNRSARGLPLMGTGDWNDGMDRVGHEGRGESIWMAWFFFDTCHGMARLARALGESAEAERLEGWAEEVRFAAEVHGWDGAWYRRAYFDDGSPLGSVASAEVRIDSIAQSWAVITGAADPERARMAIDQAWEELVREEDGIALLLTPPFRGEGPDPGYIATYPPGVRENGGQYTHAATWLLRAVARLGAAERVGTLLRMLLPGTADDPGACDRYRVEPYVLAADVYGVEPYVGRGGWTWYTGAGGWLWRVVLEDVLGLRKVGRELQINPCIPPEWPECEVTAQLDGVEVRLRILNPHRSGHGVEVCRVEGRDADPGAIPLPDVGDSPEGRRIVLEVEVVLGEGATPETSRASRGVREAD